MPAPSPLTVLPVPRIDRSFARELASEELAETVFKSNSYLREDEHPSKIVREKSEATDRLGEIYDRMLGSDLDLAGFHRKRKDAVLALPRLIVPIDSSPEAKATADFCHEALSLIPNFAANLSHQLDSKAKGIAFEELTWERLPRGPLAGAWVPVEMTDRPMWRFLFRDGVLYVRRPKGAEPIAAPHGKFLVMRHATKDSPWGAALLDEVYWAWWLKKNGLKFFAVFLDKWAQPTAIGKYRHRSGGTDAEKMNAADQTQLLGAIEAMQSEYGIVIPEGMAVELLEATRSGSASYESFIGLLTRSQALAFLGEVDTSGAAKGPGSFAKAQVSNEVRLEKVELDARELAAHLRDNLLRPLVAVNFGPEAPVPRVLIDTMAGTDRELRQKGMASVLELGLPVSKRELYLVHQVSEPGPGEETVSKEKPAPPPPPQPPPAPQAPEPEEEPEDDPDEEPAEEPEEAPEAEEATAAAVPDVALAAEPETEPDPEPAPPAFDPAEIAEIEEAAAARDRELTELAASLVEPSIAHYQAMLAALGEAYGEGAHEAGLLLQTVVERTSAVAHAEAIEASIIHGCGLALRQLQEELGERTIRFAAPPPGGATTPGSALDYWARVLGIPREEFEALTDGARRLAFTVAGVEDAAVLADLQMLVGRAISEGLTREEFVALAEQIFTSRGLTPLSRWHLELVYANNVRNAANLMRYQQLVFNPAARRLMPYLTWVTMGDDRVRPAHAAMHGYIAPPTAEIWKTWWPPAGHNCRCVVEGINVAKARRMGLTGAEPTGPWPMVVDEATGLPTPAWPDPGFAGAPELFGISQELGDRAAAAAEAAVEAAEGAGEGASPEQRDLLDALLALLSALGLGDLIPRIGGILDRIRRLLGR
ncbi:MAG TPA: DUF935 family protein [Thermoanaerobaculia bacterium]|nr:DUF935 family protein [Thermoanaerobaculia bacterium]